MANQATNNFDEPSADDVLEDTRASSTADSIGQNKLPENHDRPAAPADNLLSPKIATGHPVFDSYNDSTEPYEEGEEGIAYTFAAPKPTGDENHFDQSEKF